MRSVWAFGVVFAAALCVLLFAGSAQAAEPKRSTFAVVIGNNKSEGKRRPDLHYADDDAARYFAILQTMAPGRVALLADFDRDTQRLFPETVQLATAPTRRALEAAGRRLARDVRAAKEAGHETELYFIFAGHGDVAAGEGFIELADGRFRSSDLKKWLRAIPFTRAHVILDSCNSFFMLGVRKPGGRHFATSDDAVRALASQLPNVGVFLSTNAEGDAFEWSEIQSGIFSHVVRSGLLGAADANADGSVSYVELAAFVDTVTSSVKNPNLRPRVFARGPGAADHTPIARVRSMTDVRRFELGDSGALRLRVRDKNWLPLLDAHAEPGVPLHIALPEAWAGEAVVERSEGAAGAKNGQRARRFYAVPAPSGTVTLAALQGLDPTSRVRGPDETFHTLFAEPFGPRALAVFEATRRRQPAAVYGVSREDAQRMDLVLDQLALSERGKRVNDSVGTIGFGALLGGAGIGVLHIDDNASSGDKTEARVVGGVLIGLGGLFVLGGAGSLLSKTDGELAHEEFRGILESGGDPGQAFAAADKRLRELAAQRRMERLAEGFFGTVVVLGSATGLVWSELAADPGDERMAARLGWSAGMLAGGMMIGDAVFTETPIDTLTKIWRDDPSLKQYQTSLSFSSDGAFISLTGNL